VRVTHTDDGDSQELLTLPLAASPVPVRTRRFAVVGDGTIVAPLTSSLVRTGCDVAVLQDAGCGHDGVLEDDLADLRARLAGRDLVVVLPSAARSPWPWTAALDAVAVARLALARTPGRTIFLTTSDASSSGDLDRWHAAVLARATEPCPPWRVADLCRDLVDDAMPLAAARARAAGAARHILRTTARDGEFVDLPVHGLVGPNIESIVTDLLRLQARGASPDLDGRHTLLTIDELAAALLRSDPAQMQPGTAVSVAAIAGLVTRASPGTSNGHEHVPAHLAAAITASAESFRRPPPIAPPVRVAPPPRPFAPDVVADRQQRALWGGDVKYGNRWTRALESALADALQLERDRRVLVTTSGTDALRVAIATATRPVGPGSCALLPSFTYPATAEALVQLGYALRFVDVEANTWTLDPDAVDAALARAPADVVVAVDTMGNPARYDALLSVCGAHGVPLVADSAAALGSRFQGRPLGTQADAHAFSMSFAKAVSAGGAGGAVVVPADADVPVRSGWPRNAMSELHAAAGLDQIEVLPSLLCRRDAVRSVYEALVQRHDVLTSQAVAPGDRHVWGFWVMRMPAELRPGLMAALASGGIETKVYYPALHLAGWAGADEGLDVTEQLDAEAIALPMSSELTVSVAQRIADAVDRFILEATGP
jgi:dTDP-4-amino-4,6-dideoxygalactose transaminase